MRFALEQNRGGWKIEGIGHQARHAMGNEESSMSHDQDTHAEPLGQANFLRWLAIGLIGLMALFTLFVLGSAALHGFS
ncbi:MAG: hypothetical protein J0I99_09400 [Devosia sp.]|uniref:hypothetical protein n=1 Tax=Devosia sp. TaxID=1871048 RepID=UPI001ACC7D5C|nr:hypothetical protein [Devosia sp.]MBN9315941.1 hypothetical protein [Devosia sp.]